MEIWHNPRCSKSRQTLALLEERGAKPEVRRYLDEPPTAEELDAALRELGLEPWELARLGEARARELGLADMAHDRDAWIETMVANPILIERPIVFADSGARLGRPPESVLDLLG
jgi:arsenate reductase